MLQLKRAGRETAFARHTGVDDPTIVRVLTSTSTSAAAARTWTAARIPIRPIDGAVPLAAITVLIGTGIPLASHFHEWESGTLHVKLALVAIVAGLVVWHMRRPRVHALDGAIFAGSLAIVWLGVSLAH